jgi:hypothetical protein
MGDQGLRLSGLHLVRETTRNTAKRCDTMRDETHVPYGISARKPSIAGSAERSGGLGVAGSNPAVPTARTPCYGKGFVVSEVSPGRDRQTEGATLGATSSPVPFDSVGSLYISRRLVHILEQECGPAVDRID